MLLLCYSALSTLDSDMRVTDLHQIVQLQCLATESVSCARAAVSLLVEADNLKVHGGVLAKEQLGGKEGSKTNNTRNNNAKKHEKNKRHEQHNTTKEYHFSQCDQIFVLTCRI